MENKEVFQMNLKAFAASTLALGTTIIVGGTIALSYVASPGLVVLNEQSANTSAAGEANSSDTGTATPETGESLQNATPDSSASSAPQSAAETGQVKRTEVWTTQSITAELQKVVEAIEKHDDDFAKDYFVGGTLPDEMDLRAGLKGDGPTYREVAFDNPQVRTCLALEESGTHVSVKDAGKTQDYFLDIDAQPGDMLCMIRSDGNPTVDMSFFHVRVTGENRLSIMEWQRQFA